MARNKATVVSWGSIDGLVTYELELTHDRCRIMAKLRPEDERIIGKPEIGSAVMASKTTNPSGYIITGCNGEISEYSAVSSPGTRSIVTRNPQ